MTEWIHKAENCVHHVLKRGFFYLVLVFLFAGCKEKPNSSGTSVKSPIDGLTQNEFEFLKSQAREIELAANQVDLSKIDKFFDLKAILEAHLSDFGLRGEILTSFHPEAELMKKAMVSVISQGRPKFIRLRSHQDSPSALFRFSFDGQFDYVELIFHKLSSNHFVAVDTYEHSTGDKFSSQLLAELFQKLQSDDSVFLTRMIHEDLPKAEKLMTALLVTQARKSLSQGELEVTKSKLDKVPDTLSKNPEVLLTKVRLYKAESNLNESRQTLEELDHLYHDLPASIMMQYSLAIQNEDFTKAHEYLDQLQSVIQQDPYLDFHHAYLYNLQKDFARAMRITNEFLKTEPGNPNAWLAIFQIGSDSKNYEDASKALNVLNKKFSIPATKFQNDSRFKSFFQSPHGQKWKESQ